jgi:uncharacterized protein YgbK (DUF1537 family)
MNPSRPKIIVLDDDPTGSQTVHSCLLLMNWELETLKLGLQDDNPIFFILTNTRAMSPEKAAETTEQVCRNLQIALAAEQIDNFLIVSRSDSTLRGHYPLETDVIERKLGRFDAHFLTPAFFEGGRVTIDSVHYLIIDGVKTPVATTEFARDSVFAYHHSYLPDYVAEKTQGGILASNVERFLLTDIRNGSIRKKLLEFTNNTCVVVDGETQADFDLLAEALLEVAATGKRFLFRSAASLLTSLAQLGEPPVAPEDMGSYKPTNFPGAIIVGSHVRKTTEQLTNLLAESAIAGIEVDVLRLRDRPEEESMMLSEILNEVNLAFDRGQTPVVYTSRQELTFSNIQQRLGFGVRVSSLLMAVVRGLPDRIGFLIGKGGITSNDILSSGLGLTSARILGQIVPGCSVVRTPANHPRFPNLPVVLFPGNVGNAASLVEAWHRLRNS